MGEGFDERYGGLFVRAQRVARRLLLDDAAAEDVAAETLTRALVRWSRVSGYAEAWVTTVATNLALDQLRRRRVPATRPGSPDPIDGAEDRLGLQAAMARLPRRQREVVAMRVVLDLPEADVAAALDLSVTTVRTHLRRGLAALRADHRLEVSHVAD